MKDEGDKVNKGIDLEELQSRYHIGQVTYGEVQKLITEVRHIREQLAAAELRAESAECGTLGAGHVLDEQQAALARLRQKCEEAYLLWVSCLCNSCGSYVRLCNKHHALFEAWLAKE